MKRIYIILFLAIASGLAASAQTNSAYFMESYKFRHQLNPAFASSRSYLSLGVGNVNLDRRSNLGITTFLYPRNGQLTTFMNGAVSSDEFLGKLNRQNILGLDISENLISVGTWGKHGFTTVELNLKSSNALNLPRDLFDFMKNAGQKQSYDISNLGVRTRNSLELAIGHSHSITERLNIGAKVKFLVGLFNAEVKVDNMNINMNGDQWSVNADGSLYATSIVDIGTKAGTNQLDFNQISFLENGVQDIFNGIGFGGAIDLGATYEVIDGLTVSAAILDLGFMSWGRTINAYTDNTAWVFDGFDNIAVNNPESENTIDSQLDAMGKDLENLLVMYKEDGSRRRLAMLSATLNSGAEYTMPFYEKLSAGFLYSNRFARAYSKYEGRFFVNIHPVKWFEFSTNYGISNHGSTWGAALGLDFPGIGIFLGTDNIFWNVTSPLNIGGIAVGLPYGKANVNFTFGLTFNLSKLRHLGDRR